MMDWLKDLAQRVWQLVTYLFTTSPSEWPQEVVTELVLAMILAVAGALFFAFRKGLFGAFGRIVALLRGPKALPETTITAEQAQNQRSNLIAAVRSQWMQGYLERSLYRQVPMRVSIREQPDAVAYPWDQEVQRPSAAPKTAGISQIVRFFDDYAGTMLILGEPGSGKTITLLELGRQLLDRAQAYPSQPIPVIFSLSSWAIEKKPFDEWLVQELHRHYGVSLALGRYWVSNRKIIPLLDGLDEVRKDAREACAGAIDAYHDVRSKWVVSSKLAEYEALFSRLHAGGAVCMMALTDRDVARYVGNVRKQNLKTLLAADPSLAELARSPLMLNVMAVASEEMSPLGEALTHEQKRSRIFDTYLRRVLLEHGSARHRWAPGRALNWLRWLAQQLRDRELTVFRLEALQADWLPDTTRGLGRFVMKGSINPATHLTWQWRSGSVEALRSMPEAFIVGLVIGLVLTLIMYWDDTFPSSGVDMVTLGLVIGLYLGLSFATVAGLTSLLLHAPRIHTHLDITKSPNAGIWRSGWIWLLWGVCGGLILTAAYVLYDLLNMWVLDGPVIFEWPAIVALGLFGGLIIGFLLGDSFGGNAFRKHWLLRLLLWRYDCTPSPWKVVPWLQECTYRNLLYRTGGSYLFFHHTLMDHIARLSDDFLHDLDQEYRRRAKLPAA